MSIIDNDDEKKNIMSLKKTFLIALNNFKDNYVNYNLNSDNDEYKNIFLKSKHQLQEINSVLFDLSNQMKYKILSNHSKNQHEIESIKQSEETYNVTINKLINVGDKNRASNKLVDDYQDMYERQFYKNFQIICGVFVISFLTYKMKNI